MAFSKLPEPKLPGILSKRLGTIQGKLEAKALTIVSDIQGQLLERANSTVADLCPSNEEIDELRKKLQKAKDLSTSVRDIHNRYAKLVDGVASKVTALQVGLNVLENIIFPPLIPIPSGTIETATTTIRDLVSGVKVTVDSLQPVLQDIEEVLATVDSAIALAETPLNLCSLKNSVKLDENTTSLISDLIKRDFNKVPKEAVIKKALEIADIDTKQYNNTNYRFSIDKNNLTEAESFIINSPSTSIEVFRVVNDSEQIQGEYNDFLVYSGSIDINTSIVTGEWKQVSFNLKEVLEDNIIGKIKTSISNLDLNDKESKQRIEEFKSSLLEQAGIEDFSLPLRTYKGFEIRIEEEPLRSFYSFTDDLENLSDLDTNVREQLKNMEVVEKVNANLPRYRAVATLPNDYLGQNEPVRVIVGSYSYARNFDFLVSEVISIIESVLSNNFSPTEYIENFFRVEYDKIKNASSPNSRRGDSRTGNFNRGGNPYTRPGLFGLNEEQREF